MCEISTAYEMVVIDAKKFNFIVYAIGNVQF